MTDETTARDRAIEVGRAVVAPTADVADLSHLPVAHSGCPATAGGRCIVPGEHPDHGPAAAPERAAARAEVEVLGRHADRLGRQIDKHLAELQRLRARDEAAKALARWWNGLGGCSQAVLRDPRRGFRAGADALDALARAHETGGQDR